MRLYMWTFLYSVSVISICGGAIQTLTCADADTTACRLLPAQRHDFCKDDLTARTYCPRFCNLCPVQCYHCGSTFRYPNQCYTKVLCQPGQVCMKKEFISFADGHQEYELTCQDRNMCDSVSNLTIPFGKRHVHSRDLSVSCCADDLCNYPGKVTSLTTPTTRRTTTTAASTTTTFRVCSDRTVIFLVLSGGANRSQDTDTMKMIISLIEKMDLDTKGFFKTSVAFYKGFDVISELGNYTDKNALIAKLKTTDIFPTTAWSGDLEHTLTQGPLARDISYRNKEVIILGAGHRGLGGGSTMFQRLMMFRDIFFLDANGPDGIHYYHQGWPTDGDIQTPSIHDDLEAVANTLFRLIFSC